MGFVYSAHNVLGTGRESKLLEGARGGRGGGLGRNSRGATWEEYLAPMVSTLGWFVKRGALHGPRYLLFRGHSSPRAAHVGKCLAAQQDT